MSRPSWGDLGFPSPEPSKVPDFYVPPTTAAPAEPPASPPAAAPSAGPSQATMLVNAALADYSLINGGDGSTYAIANDEPSIALTIRGKSGLGPRLRAQFMEDHGRAAGGGAVTDALETMEGFALRADERRVFLRVGEIGSGIGRRVYVDLAEATCRAVEITADGWSVVTDVPVLFRRTRGTLTQPAPVSGSLDALRSTLNVDESGFRLIAAWLVAGFLPDIAHPILALTGQQGTAKTTAATIVLSLLDRSPASMRAIPSTAEDWAVNAAGQWGIGLDNVSNLQPWLQDALCRAVTGDAFIRRERYSDSEQSFLVFKRPVALTSIDPGALQGDVAERLLPVTLEPIGDRARRSEREVYAEADAARAGTLGALFDLLAGVLRFLPAVRLTERPRMADFAEVLAALDEATGWTTLPDYLAATSEAAQSVVDSDAFAGAIVRFARERISWEGTAAELLDLLTQRIVDPPPKGWPGNARATTARLDRVTPALRKVGVTVERRRSNGHRTTAITLGEPPAATPPLLDIPADYDPEEPF